jgi:DNA-directed RNA polymerase subunit RPC12/RpoP
MRRDQLGEYVACPMCRSRIACVNHVAASVDL